MADRSRSLKEFFSSPKPNRTNTLPASNSSTWYSSKNRNSGQKCLKRGWLRRQSFGIVKTWQSRWFVLYEDNLSYYSTDDETKSIVGQIYLRGRAVSEHASNANESSQKFVFEISPAGESNRSREIDILCAETDDDRKDWIRCIKQALYGQIGGAIFGRKLEETLTFEKSKDPSRRVPELVQMCVEYLEQYGLDMEGLFRLPGRNLLVKQLRNAFDTGLRPQLDLDSADVHTVASLLKAYLRELPEPIIPPKIYYEPVMHIITREFDLNPDESIDKMANVLAELPEANYHLLRYLSNFLRKVGEKEELNRMSNMNLATVFCQSFIEPEDNDPALLMGTADNRSKAVFVMISQYARIFRDSTTENGTHHDASENGTHHDAGEVDVVDEDESKQMNRFSFKQALSNSKLSIIEERNSLVNNGLSEEINNDVVADSISVSALRRSQSHSFEKTADKEAMLAELYNSASFLSLTSNQLAEDDESSVALDTLLEIEPSSLDHDGLLIHSQRLMEELSNQRLVTKALKSQLDELKEKHLKDTSALSKKVEDERNATSDAVQRVVEIQGVLEMYIMKYGPMK